MREKDLLIRLRLKCLGLLDISRHSMKRRIIYIAWFLVLSAVAAYSLKSGRKVYPAFIFPSFSKARQIEKTVNLPFHSILAVSETNDTVAIDKQVFFHGIINTAQNHIIERIIRKTGSGMTAHAQKEQEFREYAHNRLKEIDPSQQFVSLIFIQGKRVYHLERKAFSGDTTDLKQAVFDL